MSAGLPSWRLLADCAHRSDLDWFGESRVEIAAVKAVCAGCPVLRECRIDALERQEPWGVQAGLSAAERLEPTLLLLAVPEPPPHVASRGCYVGGCRRPDCCAANTAYNADLRSRGPATDARSLDTGEQLALIWEAS